jgi:site-specific DNA recombinase
MKAAIWWRVSTEGQREISPETQTNEARDMAHQGGYEVPQEYIIGTDWHSLSVWDSPAMNQLKELIRDRAINAVFMYDADRGPSKPAHRLLFRALCEEYGVSVRCRYGQVPDGDMGEVMEFLSAWSKEKQVNRAQQGAKDGLRDRARVKGLPTNGKAPYGFRLRYELVTEGQAVKQVPAAYEPDSSAYPVVCRIWKEAVAGTPLRRICSDLMADAIPSPRGGPRWDAATIWGMLKNPLYGGKCYALRHEAVKPKESRATGAHKREKRSVQHHSLDEAVILDFPIISPPVSWMEWEVVQERLKINKSQSQRNAKHFYLLSRMLFCGRDGRSLRGKRYAQSHYYACSLRKGEARGVEPCTLGSINGPRVEALVWDKIGQFFTTPEVFMAEMERQRGGTGQGRGEIESSIKMLQQKAQTVDGMETELVGLKLRGMVSDVAYDRQLALLKAERTHYLDEIVRQKTMLTTIEQQAQAVGAIMEIRESIIAKMEGATPERRRWLLQTLQTRVTVSPEQVLITIGTDDFIVGSVSSTKVLPLGKRS